MTAAPPDFAAPLHGFRGDARAPAPAPRGLTVAVSREAGARGTTVARKLAEILDWQLFTSDTLDYLAHDDTARAQLLADVPADGRAWADAHLNYLLRERGLTADPATLPVVRTVLAVAARGQAVIVGRGAGFVLPAATTLHVRVIAPPDARVAYMAQHLRLTSREAAEEVRARDARRALFLGAALATDAADLTAYDLVVNSDRLGAETAAQFLGWAARTKQQFSELAEPAANPVLDTLDELAGA
jgi:cytidylate kinase